MIFRFPIVRQSIRASRETDKEQRHYSTIKSRQRTMQAQSTKSKCIIFSLFLPSFPKSSHSLSRSLRSFLSIQFFFIGFDPFYFSQATFVLGEIPSTLLSLNFSTYRIIKALPKSISPYTIYSLHSFLNTRFLSSSQQQENLFRSRYRIRPQLHEKSRSSRRRKKKWKTQDTMYQQKRGHHDGAILFPRDFMCCHVIESTEDLHFST